MLLSSQVLQKYITLFGEKLKEIPYPTFKWKEKVNSFKQIKPSKQKRKKIQRKRKYEAHSPHTQRISLLFSGLTRKVYSFAQEYTDSLKTFLPIGEKKT